ncbi:MAG: hypothetical protein ACQPRH_01175 [Solitalea-like symbiont of Tyrophagus putrescentiae]
MEINLVTYLNSRETLNKITISELTKLVERYPYCAAAHMILAKKLHSRNDKAWVEALKTAAIYASDIDSLEKYICDNNIPTNTSPDPSTDSKIALKKSNTDSLTSNTSRTPLSASMVNPNSIDISKSKPTDTFNKDSLNRVQLKHTFSNTSLKSVQEPTIVNKDLETNIDSQKASLGPNNNINRDYTKGPSDPKPTPPIVTQNRDNSVEVVPNLEKYFKEWLDLSSYDNYESTIAYTPKIIKHKIRISDIEGINLINNGSIEEIEVEFHSDNQQDVIIGDFIAANPTISIYNNDPINALKAEDIIVDDSLKVVSENLVDIYMSQGLHKEAINMCRQLIIKKPEKKIHYDKKLEEIKNMMVKIR